MPTPIGRRSYAELVGEIAMGWNQIEREMNNIAFHYMTEDSTIAGFLLANLGNATKAEFIRLLVRHHEKDETGKSEVLHLVSLFNRLRENRNILEHGIPAMNHDERYLGHVYKLDRDSNFKAFRAPVALLRDQLRALGAARAYARAVRTYLAMIDRDNPARGSSGERIADLYLKQFKQPALPPKIDPLDLE